MTIKIEDLIVRYGTQTVLDQFSLEVPAGHLYLLMGPNGAGKTTLLHAIMGWIPIDAGRIHVNGISPQNEPKAARQQVGFLPEVVHLYDDLTVDQHLQMFARLHRFPGDLDEIAAQADIAPEWRHKRVAHLSKGMRQRVALALLLTKGLQTLLLDEPTSGLDPKSAWDWALRLRRLADRQRWSVLVTSHQLEHWVGLADRVGVILNGRIQGEFRPREEGSQRLLEFWQRPVTAEEARLHDAIVEHTSHQEPA